MSIACYVCGNEFEARKGARYCSGKCRTLAYRRRHGLTVPPARRRPIAERMFEVVYDLNRRVDSLERLVEDDRFARSRRRISESYYADIVRLADRLQDVAAAIGEPNPTTHLSQRNGL